MQGLEIDAQYHLVITYTDGTEQDLGRLGFHFELYDGSGAKLDEEQIVMSPLPTSGTASNTLGLQQATRAAQ